MGGFKEVGKDIETHRDETGEQFVTLTWPLKKGMSLCTGGTRRDKAKISGFKTS